MNEERVLLNPFGLRALSMFIIELLFKCPRKDIAFFKEAFNGIQAEAVEKFNYIRVVDGSGVRGRIAVFLNLSFTLLTGN